MAGKVSLKVNGIPIKLDSFVEGYIYHITSGIVASLKDTGAIRTLDLDIEKSGDLKIVLNGKDVPVNFFVTQIVRNTLAGVVSGLKGVSGKLETLTLNIE